MKDETNQLLIAILSRLDSFQAETYARFDQMRVENTARFDQMRAETKANFEQVNQRLDRVEKNAEQINQRIERLERRVAELFDRIKTLEDQMTAIGFELKQDIEKLSDRIQRMRIDFYETGAEAVRAVVVIKDFEKRIAALEAERRAA